MSNPYREAAMQDLRPIEPGYYALEVRQTHEQESSHPQRAERIYGVVQFSVIWTSRTDLHMGERVSHVLMLGSEREFLHGNQNRHDFAFLQERKGDRVFARVRTKKLRRDGREIRVAHFADEPFCSATAQTYINLRLVVRRLEGQEAHKAYVEESRKVMNQLFEKLDEEQQRMLVGEEQQRILEAL